MYDTETSKQNKLQLECEGPKSNIHEYHTLIKKKIPSMSIIIANILKNLIECDVLFPVLYCWAFKSVL